MKRGFTLIELLVALAIASIIITLLFNSFFQITQIVGRIDNIININTRAIIVQHQLEKDLMGAFLPVQAQPEEKDIEKKTKTTKEKKERKELTKIFYGINRGPMLDVLTFITNNPMSAYWSQQLGKAKPKIARVVYRFIEDKQQKGFYKLFRQEDSNLEFDSYALGGPKEIRPYELADGIKELSIKYKVILEPKEEKKEPMPSVGKEPEKKIEKKKKEIKYKTLDQWNMEKGSEISKDIKRRIPNFVEINVSFWDNKGTRAVPFTFMVQIIPDVMFKSKEKEKTTALQPTQDKKTQQSAPQKLTPGLMQKPGPRSRLEVQSAEIIAESELRDLIPAFDKQSSKEITS